MPSAEVSHRRTQNKVEKNLGEKALQVNSVLFLFEHKE
jgi:hypothetical protein